MKARWQNLRQRFLALKQRERRLVAAAVIALVGMGGYSLIVEPALIKSRVLEKKLQQQRQELVTIETQLAELSSGVKDPDTRIRASLDDTRRRIEILDTQLGRFESILVPADQIPGLLQSLLAHHQGLELVSLRTLPSTSMTDAAPSGDGASKPAPGRTPGVGGLYRHGIEIKVAGRYQDLQSYLLELESSPRKLLWERMSLATVAYPRSELTLRLYTLSFDDIWLKV